MAGRVVVSTLNNDTGVLAVQNGMTGIAKAWVNFNGTGTPAIRASFNVSSITDNGTGNYTVNFTTAMLDANYSAVCTSSYSDLYANRFCGAIVFATSSVRVVVQNSVGDGQDSEVISLSIFD
jgi:hypothetical protein